MVEIISVNFITFAFYKLFSCHDSFKNVAGRPIDDFKVVPLAATKQRMFSKNDQFCVTI